MGAPGAHVFAPLKSSKRLTVSELGTCKVECKKTDRHYRWIDHAKYQDFWRVPLQVLGLVPLEVVLALRNFLDFVGLCKGKRY